MNIDTFVSRLRPLTTVDLPAEVNPYMSLVDEIGVDSVQMYELIVLTEAIAGCTVPPDTIPRLITLADLFEYYWLCRPNETSHE